MKTKTSAAKELISDYSNGSSNLASFQTTPDDIFQQRKMEVLGKRDRSSAGRIDPKAVHICAAINNRQEYYTTSSCSGRCFMYVGKGIKSTNEFWRCRVSHDIIREAERYFDLETLYGPNPDFTGGGDNIPGIGQFDYKRQSNDGSRDMSEQEVLKLTSNMTLSKETEVWLRYEPFILHVCCRSLEAAQALLSAARPTFKNVGLTTWKDRDKYIVGIWGDEGLEMPLSCGGQYFFEGRCCWLQTLVNERHLRNWDKIDRFVKSVKKMPFFDDAIIGREISNHPKSFDVIGDIALLHSLPKDCSESELKQIGESVLKRNKALKVCAVRTKSLNGMQRAPGQAGIRVIAGVIRSPLITTHNEYGIKCVIDVENTFFSPRMGPERVRICQQVARGERVCVLFSGCGMDALQVAGRTEAKEVISIELNPDAALCARRGQRMLVRNRSVKCEGASERLLIKEGDVLSILKNFQNQYFDRILAPRPKEGKNDGDLGKDFSGIEYLEALLRVLKSKGGECHWYDFAAYHELPECTRTIETISKACLDANVDFEVIHIAKVGSVAMKQYRVCVDFRLIEK